MLWETVRLLRRLRPDTGKPPDLIVRRARAFEPRTDPSNTQRAESMTITNIVNEARKMNPPDVSFRYLMNNPTGEGPVGDISVAVS